MSELRVLITPRSLTEKGHPALERLRVEDFELRLTSPGKQPSEQELLDKLPGCQGFLAGVETISARVLESAIGLRVISRNGVGIDNIDLDAAKRLGIQICRAEGANTRGVAELTLGLIISLARAIPQSSTQLRQNRWCRSVGSELFGKTLGIIGCGRIGREVALLGLAMGMRVIGYDPLAQPFFTSALEFHYGSLVELLETSNIISLHCPAESGEKPLLDSEAFNRVNPGVLLINTARASLLDESALLAALENGKVGGVAMDVFAQEPPNPTPLLLDERVIATPHIGGYTRESIDRAVESAVDNLLCCLAPSLPCNRER